jgi:hypothetical protein
MNDLPKTLVAFDKGYGQIILSFDDKTTIKMVAACDEGDCWISESVLTNREKVKYGLMSQDELNMLKLQDHSDLTRKVIDDKLMAAWKNFYDFGPELGFPRPTLLPENVLNVFSRTDWSKIDGERTILTYRGVNFVNVRPPEN